ncbi:MAG: DNA polymerase III subunit delta' [Rhizobiales bacterium]|nr:DNA polymerase III subunit delta' [Hyphomicrobiales bacterium]
MATDDSEFPRPRQATELFGHHAAEAALLDAYRSGRMAHAWLIGGPPGIGKATLAYRMARFVLANPNPSAPQVERAASLAVDSEHLVARRIAAQGQGDLLVLERVINEDTGKLYTVIRVEDVRRTVSFFGSTAGEGGWRVCIVDSADELNAPSANALLKMLEEPPPRALFLLVSSAPGRLLPTIRSRCRRLDLRPLATADVACAAAAVSGRQPDEADIAAAAMAAEGSVARALALLDPDAMALRRNVAALLDSLPQPDPRALHSLGEALTRADQRTFEAFVDLVNAWLSERLRRGRPDPGRLARVADAWDTFNRAARDADTYNLDKKPLLFSVFGLLADTARG